MRKKMMDRLLGLFSTPAQKPVVHEDQAVKVQATTTVSQPVLTIPESGTPSAVTPLSESSTPSSPDKALQTPGTPSEKDSKIEVQTEPVKGDVSTTTIADPVVPEYKLRWFTADEAAYHPLAADRYQRVALVTPIIRAICIRRGSSI